MKTFRMLNFARSPCTLVNGSIKIEKYYCTTVNSLIDYENDRSTPMFI